MVIQNFLGSGKKYLDSRTCLSCQIISMYGQNITIDRLHFDTIMTAIAFRTLLIPQEKCILAAFRSYSPN